MVKNQAKRNKRKRPTSQKYKFYTIDGETLTRGKSCPRCGPGVFLAQSKDRSYCGKCHYTEFMGKSDRISGEEKKPEVVSSNTEKGIDESKEDKKEK